MSDKIKESVNGVCALTVLKVNLKSVCCKLTIGQRLTEAKLNTKRADSR